MQSVLLSSQAALALLTCRRGLSQRVRHGLLFATAKTAAVAKLSALPMHQAALPLTDTRATAEQWRASAETALIDPRYTPTQQRERHDYYLRQAELAERGQ